MSQPVTVYETALITPKHEHVTSYHKSCNRLQHAKK